MLKHVEKALSRDDAGIQILLCSRLWSVFSRLNLAEARSMSSLSSTGCCRERLCRREGEGLVRTSAGRRRAVGMECLESDGNSQMGH